MGLVRYKPHMGHELMEEKTAVGPGQLPLNPSPEAQEALL